MGEKRKTTASKETSQAKANKFWENDNQKNKKKSTVTKVAGGVVGTIASVKTAKKIGLKGVFIVIICFLFAIIIGASFCFVMGKDDCFEIVGSEELEFQIGETYKDEGVLIKEFGINISKSAKIQTNLKVDENGNYYQDSEGTFYIAYTVKSLKFGLIYNVQKIRLVTFVEQNDDSQGE